MGAWISTSSWRRFLRHLPEVLGILAVTLFLDQAGLIVDQPAWLFPTLLITGAALISAAYSRWDHEASASEVWLRALTQVGALAIIVFATGWGFALVPVFLFAVADNVRYSGSRAVTPVLVWSGVFTALGQGAIAVDLVPVGVDPTVSHALALLTLMVLTLVAVRVRTMTEDKEEAEASAADSERRFRNLVQESSDVIMVIGDARVTYVSPSLTRVLGYSEDRILGEAYLDLVHPDDRQDVIDFVTGMMDTPGATGLIECRLQHAEGHWVSFESSCHNLLHDPQIKGFVTTGRDITRRKALEDELEHRAFHDGLTGLANRSLFRDRVDHTVARAGREDGLRYAVLYVDLDNFKVINDTLGHAVGDELLVHVSDVLRECIREVDTAARLGGDEFALLIDGMKDESGAARVAARALEELRREVTVQGHDLTVEASIGIATCEPGQTGDELLRNADIAMYMAKSAGKGCYEIFEPSMHLQVVERLRMEADLQRAIERDEFILHYQPIVQLEDGGIRGVEALIRWNHPERGMVSPGDFIPLAEETGLVVPMGRWVLHEACRQIVDWQDRYETDAPLHVSVNVSMRQFSHGDIVADVRSALESSGLDPQHLTLELTESALVQDTDATITILRRLKTLGVRLAVDDFGTGYSSLAYLQRFPVDVLKIDRSFVEGMVSGSQNPALVRAIVELGHSLRLETVAEGIEHDEELTQFRALHCNLGQGYLFARPGTGDTIERLIAGTSRAKATIVLDDAVSSPPR